MSNTLSKIAFLGLAVAAQACNQTPAEPTPAPAQAKAAVEAKAGLDAHDLEHTELNAPYVLKLITPTAAAVDGVYAKAGETVTVKAVVTAPAALKVPVKLSLKLPTGATLDQGTAAEDLKMPKGKLSRTFKVKLTKDLTEAAPIKVAATLTDPNGAFGAKAERLYPAPTTKVSKVRKAVPPPPGGRPFARMRTPVAK